MEQGSPQNSTPSSSLEQSKLTSIMPQFLSPRQLEKRPRIADDEEEEEEHTTSYLALLTGGESPKAQQIGPSFPRPPIFATFGNLDFNNVIPTTPTPIRPTAVQIGTRNAPYLSSATNFERSTLKRKMVSADDTAPNPNTIRNFSDQGYNNSRNYGSVGHGYSVYDEKYRALGLPVDPHLRMFNQIYGKGNAGFS